MRRFVIAAMLLGLVPVVGCGNPDAPSGTAGPKASDIPPAGQGAPPSPKNPGGGAKKGVQEGPKPAQPD